MSFAWLFVALVGTVVIVVLAGIAGAGAAFAFQAHHSRGERARFEAELSPLRESIGELGDRFDHFYKRERKRERDDLASARTERGAGEHRPLTRAQLLLQMRSRGTPS